MGHKVHFEKMCAVATDLSRVGERKHKHPLGVSLRQKYVHQPVLD